MTIGDQELTRMIDTYSTILDEVRDASLIPNLFNLFHKERIYNLKLRYVRGYWMWLMCDSVKSCKYFTSNAGIQNIFS